MSLVDALEPFLSFSETDLKGVFPWKPLKYPNSLLGKYLQKDGVQASSFQNFLQTYLDAHQLIGSVLSIFQERYSFIKKIIDDKNSGIKKDYYQSLLESLANRLVEFTKTKDMDLLCKMMDDLVALEFQSITDSMHPNKGLEELKSFVRGHVRYSETKKTDFLKLLEGELLFVSWQNKIEAFKQWLEDPLFSNFHFFHSEEGLSLYDLRQKMGTIRFIVNAWVKKALHDLGLPALYGRLFDYANCNEQDHFSTWMVRKILYTRYERALTDFPEKDEDLETLREEVKSLPLQERIQKTKDLLESKDQPRYRQLMEVLTQVDWDINLV
jgi:hypothetical protein